jgi:predicted ester cyclase
MTTEQNKAIVRRFFEAFEANDIASLKEVLAPELVAYTHASPDPQSRDAQLQAIEMWNAVFSETRFTIQEQIAEGDKVATRVTMQAVHDLGDFQGLAPSGKQIEVTGISIERIKEGKIVERLVSSDWFGMMQQLGLIPPQPAYG